jgi:HAMP domain-containing protein
MELVKLYEEYERIKDLRDNVRKGEVSVSVNIQSTRNFETIYAFTETSAEVERVMGMADYVRAEIVERMKDQLDALKDKISYLGGDAP